MAITIKDVRQKYPDYEDLSDQELADKLHSKYYSDLPKEDFYRNIGLNKGSENPEEDQKKSLMSDFKSILKNEISDYPEPVNPLSFVNDIGIGLGKAGQGIASTLTGGYAPTVNFDEMSLNKNPKIQNKLIQGLAQYAPFALAGGSGLIGQLAAGAGFGATQTAPNEENAGGFLPSGKTGGAIESALINLLTHGAGKGLEALRPSKLFRGNLSPEELQRNLDITKGTETGLGDVIGSPLLKKKLENTLTMTPFSGANESLQRTGKEVVSRGENILSEMLGNNDPENVPEQVTKDLLKQHKNQREIKNSFYNDFNEEADKQFLNLNLAKFSSKAKEFKDALESTNILKYEPEMKSILSKLGIYENPVEKIPGDKSLVSQFGEKMIGDPLTTYKLPTAKEANLLKGKLNEYKNMYKSSPEANDRFMAKIFGELHSAIKEDINEAVEKSGNEKLKNKYNIAEDNYRKNYSKFLDKDIYRYIGGNKNPEQIISNFIKTSPHADLASGIAKLSSTLPPQSKNLLAYSYFSRALDNEGNLNPAKMGTAIEKLKPNQFKALVPDASLRKKLKDYSKLQHMNKEAQNLMFNPKTGQRTTDVLITGLLSALGKIGSGNIAALGAPAAAIGAGKMATKVLTNEKLREALVKKMLENKPKIAKPANIKGTQSLLQSLSATMGQ